MLASTVKNGFEDSDRRQKVENWRHGQQIGGTIKAILIKRRDFKKMCPTLCDPIDGSPPGFPVPGILQARTLEWAAISFSNA